MTNTFNTNGIRETATELSAEIIDTLRSEWKTYMHDVLPYPGKFYGKGIVMCAGGMVHFTCAWVNIKMLRASGCQLPIEVWHYGEELSAEAIDELESLGAQCRNFLDYGLKSSVGFMLKPLAILNSQFKEVLFLDADNICVKDPTGLFYAEEYLQKGAVFWPDYWSTSAANPIWAITGAKMELMQEQESGQLLLNKERCWPALNLCVYFNANSEFYYKILLGDKDTFKFAWLSLNTPFHWMRKEVGSCGYLREGQYYGITMVQHGFSDEIFFLHRNLVKWIYTPPEIRIWHQIKRFKVDAGPSREYHIIRCQENKHLYIDLKGEIETLDFNSVFPGFEDTCMDVLQQLRGSDMYRRFAIYSKSRRTHPPLVK